MANGNKKYFGGLNRNYFATPNRGNKPNPYASNPGIVSAAVAQGVKSAQAGFKPQPRYTQDELDRMRADNVVAANLDASPSIQWSNYENLPQSFKDVFDPIVDENAAKSGYLKHIQQNMGKTDFIGRSKIAGDINGMNDTIVNKIPNQLKYIDDLYGKFDEDADSMLISNMMNPKDKEFISNIMHGKIKPEVDGQGNITFNGVAVKDLPNYEVKDIKTGSMLTKNLTGAYDRGRKLTDSEIALQRVNMTQTLNEGGVSSILSVGFEDVMGFGTPLLDQSQYANEIAALNGDDPQAKMDAKKSITNAITEEYLKKLTEQANAGYNFKNPPNPEGGTQSKYGQLIDDKVNSGGEFTIPVGSKQYQVVKYGDGYKLFIGTSAYPTFDVTNPMRNTRTLSSDPAKRKQQILEAVTGDVSQGFDWSTPETDWSSDPNVPFIGPMPAPTADPSIITNN